MAKQTAIRIRTRWKLLEILPLDAALRDQTDGILTANISAEYFLTEDIAAGVYAELGMILPKCADGASCSSSDLSSVGLGIGREISSGSSDVFGQSFEFGVSGWDATLDLRAGFPVFENARLGPVLTATLGRYDSASSTVQEQTQDREIAETRFHGWIMLGVGGSYTL